MRIERADITKHVENYNPEVTEKYIFKNPVTYAAREAGVKEKIFNATQHHSSFHIHEKGEISLGIFRVSQNSS